MKPVRKNYGKPGRKCANHTAWLWCKVLAGRQAGHDDSHRFAGYHRRMKYCAWSFPENGERKESRKEGGLSALDSCRGFGGKWFAVSPIFIKYAAISFFSVSQPPFRQGI